MGFPGLGVLAQTLVPAIAGGHRGMALAEKEFSERRLREQEAERAARLQALRETLLQSQEARDAEMHPLNMQTERARALSALPTFAEAPDQLPGGTPSEEERLKLDEIRSRISENNAQAEAARRSASGKGSSVSRTEAARQERQEAEGVAFLGQAAKGGANDPIIGEFGRAFREIRKLHPEWSPGRVAYQAKEALQNSRPDLFPNRQRASAASESDFGESEGNDVPYRFRKFPSETLPIYLQRLKQNNIDSTTARSYIEAQGLDLE